MAEGEPLQEIAAYETTIKGTCIKQKAIEKELKDAKTLFFCWQVFVTY